ncbi:MAG TPA: sigma-70 family RNA polymerase sigma factor [Brumimicrobium sp.]|nr:sigma-70 family RNA polymerase sigma factor [Brumimicrobium sp.]
MRTVNPIYHHSFGMLMQEKELINRAKQDPIYFAPLYRKYYDQIFRYVLHRMKDEELASDVTSQVFFKALSKLHTFEYRGVPLSSWLYRIAMSELNQAYRDQRAKREIPLDNVYVATFMEVFEEETNTLSKNRLFHAMSQLNGQDLQLIKLRYYEDRSYREIGEVLNIKENNAKVKTFRALEKLKRLFYSERKNR